VDVYDASIDAVFTERLMLRPFQAGDLSAFVAYRQDPVVARYQSWDLGYSIADAERFLAELEGVGLGRPGVWVQHAIVDRADGSLIRDWSRPIASGADGPLGPCAL
jgi:aminoglycoside 6'-N-acetyltransferase